MEITQKEDGTFEVDGNPVAISTVVIEGYTTKYVQDSDERNHPVETSGENDIENFRAKLIKALGNPDLYQR